MSGLKQKTLDTLLRNLKQQSTDIEQTSWCCWNTFQDETGADGEVFLYPFYLEAEMMLMLYYYPSGCIVYNVDVVSRYTCTLAI
jgi:hypothetical protein